MFDTNPDVSTDTKRRGIFANNGFKVGLFGGILMIIIHLILLIMFDGRNSGDLIAWVIQLFLYFFLGKVAANKELQLSIDQNREKNSVQSAGLGAALVISLIVWIFIIVRGLVRDALGIFIISNPVSLFCVIVADVIIALGLGSLAGKSVIKKNQDIDQTF